MRKKMQIQSRGSEEVGEIIDGESVVLFKLKPLIYTYNFKEIIPFKHHKYELENHLFSEGERKNFEKLGLDEFVLVCVFDQLRFSKFTSIEILILIILVLILKREISSFSSVLPLPPLPHRHY